MILFGTVVCSCSTACFSSPCLHDYLPETLLPNTPQQGQKFPLVPRKWLNSSSSSYLVLTVVSQRICHGYDPLLKSSLCNEFPHFPQLWYTTALPCWLQRSCLPLQPRHRAFALSKLPRATTAQMATSLAWMQLHQP